MWRTNDLVGEAESRGATEGGCGSGCSGVPSSSADPQDASVQLGGISNVYLETAGEEVQISGR